MNFKIGQRVRVVSVEKDCNRHMVGATGVIMRSFDWFGETLYEVAYDQPRTPGDGWAHAADCLAPILSTPSAADILAMQELPRGPIRDPSLIPERVGA